MSKREGYSYLNGNKWVDITREERFFCLVAFNTFNAEPKSALKWINKKCQLGLENSFIDQEEWEVGFEVALYRDYIHHSGDNFKNKKTRFRKRTFDLCFFSENLIIIIEAKAHSGLNNKQLKDFKEDRSDIKRLLFKNSSNQPGIIFIVLKSSKYNPNMTNSNMHEVFDGKPLNWMDLFKKYREPVFKKADDVYPLS